MKKIYTITLVILVLMGFWIFGSGLKIYQLDKLDAINMQQVLVILVFAGIPGVLVWSKKKVKVLKLNDSDEARLDEYKKVQIVRLIIFSFLGIFTLLVQLLSDLKGLGMLYLVILVLFMFIWPTQTRKEVETKFDQKEENSASQESDDYDHSQDDDEEEEIETQK